MSRLLFVAVALVVSAPSFAAPSDKEAIQGLYSKLAAAMRAKDAKAIAALCDTDFTTTEKNGTVHNARQTAKSMEDHFKSLKRILDLKMTPRSIAIKGNRAQAVRDYKIAAVIIAEGKPLKFETSGSTKDTLSRTAEGWKFKAVRAMSAKTLIDGKEMPEQPSRPTSPTGRGRPTPAR